MHNTSFAVTQRRLLLESQWSEFTHEFQLRPSAVQRECWLMAKGRHGEAERMSIKPLRRGLMAE